MAQALPAIVAVVSAAATVYSVVQQKQAADEARDIANRNAARQAAEAEETARRKEKEAKRVEGMARARAFASGVGGESQAGYLEELRLTHEEEIDWIRRAGASGAAITQAEGRRAQRIGYAGAVSDIGKGVSQQYQWWSTYGS